MELEIPIPEGDGKIPDLSPVIDQNEEAPEIKPYKISFDDKYYKSKECEVHGLKKQNGACALKIIRDIGVYFTDPSQFALRTLSFIEIKHVVNSGSYKALYKGLEADENIYEIKCVHEDRRDTTKDINFRVFYALNEDLRIFQVVAIRESHYSL